MKVTDASSPQIAAARSGTRRSLSDTLSIARGKGMSLDFPDGDLRQWLPLHPRIE